MARIDSPHHAKLETDVILFLESLDFLVNDLTYHKNPYQKDTLQFTKTNEWKQRLSEIYTITALAVRTTVDHIAVHKSLPLVLRCEVKTHDTARMHDMVLEAFPLAIHKMNAAIGIKCIYFYRDSQSNPIIECGFLADNMPPIRQVRMPIRPEIIKIHQQFEFILKASFGEYEHVQPTKGSGDPHVIIDETEVKKLPHWKKIVEDLIKDTQ